jgi:hypothetical protein
LTRGVRSSSFGLPHIGIANAEHKLAVHISGSLARKAKDFIFKRPPQTTSFALAWKRS